MNAKLNRVLDEIKRTEDKIAAWQEHLEELNIRKNQLEDAEIIKSIRSMKLGSREMLAFLENIRNGAVPAQQGQHIGEARQEEIMPGEAEISGSRKKRRQKERTGKMKKTVRNLAAMLVMAAAVLLSGKMTAYAYVDETAEAVPEPVISEETPEETETTPFSVAGNGQLLDDISDDETKQFLTVQTKNGNTFFMVIDRSRNSENVYMLSLIDENDLAEFLGEDETELEEEKPAVAVEEPRLEPVQEEPRTEPEKGGMGMGAVLTMILLGAGSIGAYYYFKIWKPKREEEEAESEDLEFYDGGAYVNEDRENGKEEGESEEPED